MSQTEAPKAEGAEERTEETRSFVRRVRTANPAQAHSGGKDPYRAGGVPPGRSL